MPPTVDFLPVATGSGANVESQSAFLGSTHQLQGFQSGLAVSSQLNKCWRQSSMMAAAIANAIAARLNANVLDDGNLANLIALIEGAFPGPAIANPASITVNANTTGNQNLLSVPIPAGVLNVLGKAFRITTTIYMTASTTLTGGIALSWPGSSVTFAELLATPGNLSSQFKLTIDGMVTAIGSSGSIALSVDTTTVPPGEIFDIGLSFVPLDLTSAFAFQFLANFSVASSSNSALQVTTLLEYLN